MYGDRKSINVLNLDKKIDITLSNFPPWAMFYKTLFSVAILTVK
jgi:hypothetical protein